MTDHVFTEDLDILAAMAAEMDTYLASDVLFWPMQASGMPKLTLGGYLMRQERLLAVADELDGAQQALLNTAVSQFNAALSENVVRLETKAHTELEARIRQWSEYLRDLGKDYGAVSAGGYATAVEARTMIKALVDKLQTRPYQLSDRIPPQIGLLDSKLRGQFAHGDFVWADEWQAAYPEEIYWWLYGLPVRR